MTWQSGIIRALALVLIVCTGYSSVFAETYQQNAPSLDGKTILFAINNNESNPFSTEPEGASRLASILTRNGATVDLVNWSAPIPPDTDLVILAGARFNYSGDRVARLWSYIETGGSVFLLIDPPTEQRSVQANNPLFSLLWSDFGIRTSNTIALNPRQDVLPQTNNAQGTPVATPTAMPHIIPPQLIDQLNSNNASHPILQGLSFDSLAFLGLRPIEMQNFMPNATVTELLVTDEQPYGESDFLTFADSGVYHFDEATDQNRRSFVAAIASENSATGSRIVVVGDGDIARNNFGFSTSPPTSEAFVYADSARLVLNATYWLLDIGAPELSIATAAPTATRTITPSPSASIPATEPPATVAPDLQTPDSVIPIVPVLGTPQPTIQIPLPPLQATATPG